MSGTRPQLVSARAVATLEAVRTVTGGGFDVEAWYVMDQRDNALIADEVLHGPGSSSFVYRFEITPGKEVTGISVIGARHLANHYQGLKHRIVASEEKRGATIEFKAYPSETEPRRQTRQRHPRARRRGRLLHRPLRDHRHQDGELDPGRAARVAGRISARRNALSAAELRDHRAVEGLPKRGAGPDPAGCRDPLESGDAQARQDRDDHRVGARREAREGHPVCGAERAATRTARGRSADPRPDQRPRRRVARGSASGLCRSGEGARPRDRAGDARRGR